MEAQEENLRGGPPSAMPMEGVEATEEPSGETPRPTPTREREVEQEQEARRQPAPSDDSVPMDLVNAEGGVRLAIALLQPKSQHLSQARSTHTKMAY